MDRDRDMPKRKEFIKFFVVDGLKSYIFQEMVKVRSGPTSIFALTVGFYFIQILVRMSPDGFRRGCSTWVWELA